MILVVWLLSAVAALGGIRLAAVGLLVGAGFALATGSAVQAAGAWASVTAAALLLAGYVPRRMAVPVVVAAAAIVAGTASNAVVFLPAWGAGTLLLAAAAPRSRPGRSWALGLVLSDVPVAAAGLWLALEGPLATWLSPMPRGPASLLAVAAVVRVMLPAAWAPLEYMVVGVRAQALVALALASQAETGPLLALGGALAFGAAGVWSYGLRRDMLQEVGLLAVVLSVPIVGTGPSVALLGSTTLLMLVRLTVPRPSSVSWSAAAVARSCALGSPLWPVSAAILIAAARDPSPAAGLVAGGLIAGLWGRASDRPSRVPVSRAAPALAGTALAAGWSAPLLWGDLGSSAAAWPGPVALAVVGLGAAIGALCAQRPDRLGLPRDLPAPSAHVAPPVDAAPRTGSWQRAQRVASARAVLAVPAALLVGVAVAAFLLGWLKGFL